MDDDLNFDALASGLGEVDTGEPPASDALAEQPAADAASEKEADEQAIRDIISGGTSQQDDDRAWQRELRKLNDEALARAGIDPSERHQHGLSRREVVRRFHAAERLLRDDLGQGLSMLVQGYAGGLAPEQRSAVAGQVLRAFGFDAPQSLAEHDLARLRQYDERAAAERQAMQQLQPRLEQAVAQFSAQRPDFDQLRGTMAALLQAGEARDLPSAYELARKVRGLPSSFEEQARAADDARRSKVAAAKAAGTPQTRSGGQAPEQTELSPTDDAKAALRSDIRRILGERR
jgi:hypothetical protein